MGWIRRGLVLCALALAALVPASAQAPKRVALVIGNAAYAVPAWRLDNPVRDADLMAARLRALNFEVDLVRNASLPQMTAAFERFSMRLRGAGPSAVSVVYYSAMAPRKARSTTSSPWTPTSARRSNCASARRPPSCCSTRWARWATA